MVDFAKHFMIKRPEPGRAFYCPADASMLLHIAVSGRRIEHQSNTNDRSIAILLEQKLIQRERDNDNTHFILTDLGQKVFDTIVQMRLP